MNKEPIYLSMQTQLGVKSIFNYSQVTCITPTIFFMIILCADGTTTEGSELCGIDEIN